MQLRRFVSVMLVKWMTYVWVATQSVVADSVSARRGMDWDRKWKPVVRKLLHYPFYLQPYLLVAYISLCLYHLKKLHKILHQSLVDDWLIVKVPYLV